MRLVEPLEFLEECREQRVVLDPQLQEHLADEQSFALLWSINQVGKILGWEPAAALTEKKIEPSKVTEADATARILRNIINNSLDRSPRPGIPSFESKGKIPMSGCMDAEWRFLYTLGSVGRVGIGGSVGPYGSQIIVGDDMTPLMLRKREGEKSGLTLTPVAINGLEIPVGSIVGLEIWPLDGSDDQWPDPGRVEIIDSDRVKNINFRRISVFALPLAERLATLRAVFDMDRYKGESDWYRRRYRTTTISQIVGATAAAVSRLQ